MSDAESRAIRAQEILSDPLFVEVFDTVRSDLVAKWQSTGTDDADHREALYHRIKALERIRMTFEEMLRDGKIDMFKRQQATGR